MSSCDKERRQQVRKLLASGGLRSGQDFRYAAFVFIHGDQSGDYLMAHVLAMVAMSKGDTKARWIAAATLDRYLQSQKNSQVFGTEYKMEFGTGSARKVTQAPYDKDFLSDFLRDEFCVTTYANQQLNLAAMGGGKGVEDLPYPDGCR